MNDQATNTAPSDSADPPATASAYALIGGADGVQALVDRFYDLMELEPEFRQLRAIHGSSLDGARQKLFLFLSGWLGGPDLYVERYGHPRLRARHLPFAIGTRERDEWLTCMARAMDELALAPALRTRMAQAFAKTADWMRNQPG